MKKISALADHLPARWRAPLGALFCGALAAPAFAPYHLWPLAFFSLWGLHHLLAGRSGRQGFLVGLAFGLGLNLPGLAWIHVSMTEFGGLSLPLAMLMVGLLAAYLALFPALACGLLNRFFSQPGWMRPLLALPALWLLADWGMGHVLTGFPWLWLGYSQLDTWLTGYAPLLGVQGVTLVVLLASGALYLATAQRRPAWLLLPLLLFVMGAGLRTLTWTHAGGAVKFALMQGNIPQSAKWDPRIMRPTLLRYMDMSRLNQDADIIIWPESAIPALENDVQDFLTVADKSMRFNETGFITGIQILDTQTDRYYNAVIGLGMMDADGLEEYHFAHPDRYYKYHLLPIGEFVPLQDWLRPIAPFFNLPMSSFSRGAAVQPNLLAKGYRFATAICYEIAFSEELRRNVKADTQFIVTVSNDTWFGTSGGPWQHMAIARMRAIELGKPVLRATNSGVTLAIGADGQVLGQLPQFQQAVLRVEAAPHTGLTPYNRWGSWPLIGLVMAGLVGAGWRQCRLRPLGAQSRPREG